MSNQSQANETFKNNQRLPRSTVIAMIINKTGVSAAYASTLYANAKKFNNAKKTNTPVVPTKTPSPKSPMSTFSKTKQFDRANLRDIRVSLDAALAAVAEQYGISINVGNMRFYAGQFTTKLTATIGSKEDAGRNDWNTYAYRFGFEDSDFGKAFTSNGLSYTICGVRPMSRKFPIIGISATGRKVCFPRDVKSRMK